jgi:hypothetical protein
MVDFGASMASDVDAVVVVLALRTGARAEVEAAATTDCRFVEVVARAWP